MAKRISKDDIFESGLFNEAIKDAKELIGVFAEMRDEIKKFGKESKESVGSLNPKGSASDQDKLKKKIQELTSVRKNQQQVELALARAQGKLIQLNDRNAKSLEANKIATRELRNSIQELVKAKNANKNLSEKNKIVTDDLTGSYRKQSQTLIALRKRYKDLAAAGKGNTEEARRILKETKRLDSELKKIDATVGQNQRSVGNYVKALGGIKGAFTKIAGALGLLQIFESFAEVLRKGLDITIEFERANSELAAILGKTTSETAKLQQNAKLLGQTTQFTATQVTSLQTELAKLGFREREILNATEGVLGLAAATGVELPRAASFAGSTIRSFGLDAEESGRVVDVLSKATTISALTFDKLEFSIRKVAPVAKNAGFSLEQTTAALGAVVDKGVVAETAGRALRNIFLKTAQQGLSFKDALDKIENSADKNATALELFGAENAVVATILSESQDKIKGFTEALEGSEGAATRLAEEKLDNLAGDLTKLSSAFEALVLSVKNSTGFLRDLTQTITSVIRSITSVTDGVNEVKDATISNIKETRRNIDFNKSLVKSYDELTSKENLNAKEKKKLQDVTDELISRFGESVVSIDDETGALRLNIQAVRDKIRIDSILQDDRAKSLLADKAILENRIRQGEEAARKFSSITEKISNDASALFRGETGGELLKEIESLDIGLEKLDSRDAIEIAELINLGGGFDNATREILGLESQLRKLQSRLNVSVSDEVSSGIKEEIDDITQEIERLENLTGVAQKFSSLKNELEQQIIDVRGQLNLSLGDENQDALRSNLDLLNGQLNTLELIERRSLITAKSIRSLDFNESDLEIVIAKLEALGVPLDALFKDAVNSLNNGLDGLGDGSDELTGLIEKQAARVALLREQIEKAPTEVGIQKFVEELEIAQRELERLREIGDDDIFKSLSDSALEEARRFDDRFLEAQGIFVERVKVLEDELAKARSTLKGDELIEAEEKIFAIRKVLEEDFSEEVRQISIDRVERELASIELLTVERKAQLKEELDAIDSLGLSEEKANTRRLNAEEAFEEDILKLKDEASDKQKELNDLKLKDFEATNDKIVEDEKNTAQELKTLAASVAEFLINLNKRVTDEMIADKQREIDDIKKRESLLTDLAAQGDKQAAETLQADEKRRAEKERRIEREQERSARRELIITAFKIKAENPDASNIQILSELVALPALAEAVKLYEGTEHVESSIGGKAVYKGKDAYLGMTKSGSLFRFDGEERILNPSQNRTIGAMTNDELTGLAEMANKGMLTLRRDRTDVGGMNNNAAILRKFDMLNASVNKLSENQQKIEIYWDSLEKAWIEKTKTANKIHTKHTKTGGIWGR